MTGVQTCALPICEITWENTNKLLDKHSPFFNEKIVGMKTGTMASSYSVVAIYEEDGKEYLITCLAARSDEGRYRAVQSAINIYID